MMDVHEKSNMSFIFKKHAATFPKTTLAVWVGSHGWKSFCNIRILIRHLLESVVSSEHV